MKEITQLLRQDVGFRVAAVIEGLSETWVSLWGGVSCHVRGQMESLAAPNFKKTHSGKEELSDHPHQQPGKASGMTNSDENSLWVRGRETFSHTSVAMCMSQPVRRCPCKKKGPSLWGQCC